MRYSLSSFKGAYIGRFYRDPTIGHLKGEPGVSTIAHMILGRRSPLRRLF